LLAIIFCPPLDPTDSLVLKGAALDTRFVFFFFALWKCQWALTDALDSVFFFPPAVFFFIAEFASVPRFIPSSLLGVTPYACSLLPCVFFVFRSFSLDHQDIDITTLLLYTFSGSFCRRFVVPGYFSRCRTVERSSGFLPACSTHCAMCCVVGFFPPISFASWVRFSTFFEWRNYVSLKYQKENF